MRLLAIIIVLAAFPAFLALLKSPRYRRWPCVVLGALPILYVPLNLDASFISWPLWPGYVRGLLLTIMDPLALAICVRFARGRAAPGLLWAFAIYFCSCIPSLLLDGYMLPAAFVLFQILRLTIFFYAVYLAVLNGQLVRIAEGLAIAAILSGAVSGYHALSGAVRAEGILGHQNLSGLATNLCIPLLLALGLSMRRYLFLLAVAAAMIGAVSGGSRATMILLATTVAGTLAVTMIVKPTGRTLTIATLACIGLVAAVPFAINKLDERKVSGLELDPERIAFERTAELMIADHPWGVGLNQYVTVANEGGYFDRAGVRWGYEARSTSVHNTYLLIHAEAGLLGLCGLLVWLVSPILLAGLGLLRKDMVLREVSAASGFALIGVAIHSRYEWVAVTAAPQYLIALQSGVIAALWAYSAQRRKAGPTTAAAASYSRQRNAHGRPDASGPIRSTASAD
jgi:O-antigen ligase